MQRLFITALACLITVSVFSQEVINEAKIQFELPNKHWKFIEKQNANKLIIYTYRRDFIVDSSGRKIDPQISFLIEPVDSTLSVVEYSIYQRDKGPFDVGSMFNYEDGTMKFQYGIGYQGKYVDRGLEHRIYVVHGIYNSMGITLIMDTSEELAEIVSPEFLKALSTFDVIK